MGNLIIAMLANVATHAERISTVKTMSLTIYSMYDSYRMSPEDIRRKGSRRHTTRS